jgi:hypothetical protein
MSSENFTGWRKASYSHANSDCVEVGWRKATHSNGNGACIEVAADQQVVGVRDTTQHGRGQVLQFTATAWHAFVANTRHANV